MKVSLSLSMSLLVERDGGGVGGSGGSGGASTIFFQTRITVNC